MRTVPPAAPTRNTSSTQRETTLWRPSWRFEGWSGETSTKSRIFWRRTRAEAWIEKLRAAENPERGRLFVSLERCNVRLGRWELVEGGAA